MFWATSAGSWCFWNRCNSNYSSRFPAEVATVNRRYWVKSYTSVHLWVPNCGGTLYALLALSGPLCFAVSCRTNHALSQFAFSSTELRFDCSKLWPGWKCFHSGPWYIYPEKPKHVPATKLSVDTQETKSYSLKLTAFLSRLLLGPLHRTLHVNKRAFAFRNVYFAHSFMEVCNSGILL